MRLESDYSDKEIRKRYRRIYGDDDEIPDDRLPALRKKLASLSELIRDIKVSFARYITAVTAGGDTSGESGSRV